MKMVHAPSQFHLARLCLQIELSIQKTTKPAENVASGFTLPSSPMASDLIGGLGPRWSARLAQEAEGASRLMETPDRISERPPRGGLSVLVNCEFWARWIADTFIGDLPHKMLASFLCD